MKFDLEPQDVIRLRGVLASGLEKSLSPEQTGTSSAQTEPQLVAKMVWHIPHAINSDMFQSNGIRITSGGVFVHQQPKIKCFNFPSQRPASVEIGDLLLLRQEIASGQVRERSAMLLQAKKYTRLPSAPDNRNQHYVYANWPEFKYLRSTKLLNNKLRQLTGHDLFNGAKYLLIRETSSFLDPSYWYLSGDGGYGFTANPTEPDLSNYRSFLSELTEFVIGNAGKAFVQPPPASSIDWDRVINDLIEVTAQRTTTYIRNLGMGTEKRGPVLCFMSGTFADDGSYSTGASSILSSGDLRSMMADHVGMFDEPPQVPSEPVRTDDEGTGIPIIEFSVYTDSNGNERRWS